MSDDIGYIYLALNDNQQGLVKIGYTRGSVEKRLKELSAATGVSRPFREAYSCKVQNPEAVETQLHQEFAFCRESDNKEFFRIDWRAVKAALRMMQADNKRMGENLPDDNIVSQFALVKYVKDNDTAKLRRALAISRCNPNQADENNQTALMWAAELGHAKIVDILMNGKANPNKADKDGWTALMLAAGNGHANIVKALLDYGANVNAAADKEGDYTALTVAIQSSNSDIDTLPPMYRFRHQLVHQIFRSPDILSLGLPLSVSQVIELSLNHGVPQSEFLNEPKNAEFMGSDTLFEILEELTAQGWLEKLKGEDSYKANDKSELYQGTKESAKAVIGVLLDGGAKLSDSKMESALKHAAKAGHADIVKMLRERGGTQN